MTATATYAGNLRSAVASPPVFPAVLQRHPAPGGPGRAHRVSQDEPCASFADGWHLGAIEPATTGITTGPDVIRAWLAALTRT